MLRGFYAEKYNLLSNSQKYFPSGTSRYVGSVSTWYVYNVPYQVLTVLLVVVVQCTGTVQVFLTVLVQFKLLLFF